VYHYYLQYVFKKPDMVALIHPSELSDIIEAGVETNDTFLIVVESLSDAEICSLSQMGFDPIKTSNRNRWLGQSLFVRKAGLEDKTKMFFRARVSRASGNSQTGGCHKSVRCAANGIVQSFHDRTGKAFVEVAVDPDHSWGLWVMNIR
ncbi:MAG: hypothetical protein ABIJ53_02555, partial [Verrucomicrobiota bacterium]